MEDVLRYFFPGDCYSTVVEQFNFFDGPCLKLLNSRVMSMNIILGAIVVKLPQIIKIVRASSVENLSYLAFLLELMACTFMSAYSYSKGFPFSTWGESLFIAVQVVIILSLMFHYNSHLPYLALFLPSYAVLVWYLSSGLPPSEVMSALQAVVTPVMAISRLTQIYTTFKNGTTGQLAFITSFLNWAGVASRIYTTVQETGDPLILLNYVTMFAINSIILVQFYVYWNATPTLPKEKREGQGEGKKER